MPHIRNAFKKTCDYLQIIRRYKNCNEILAEKFRKKRHSKIVLRNGIQIAAPNDHPYLLAMVNETFFAHIHTPPDLQIEKNDVVVDIGANIGIFTLFSAHRTTKVVHAFEPSPKNVEFLKRNIKSNKLDNVIVHNLAVCDNSEKLTKIYLRDSVGHSLFTCDNKLEEYIEVPSITLQDIMDDIVTEEIGFLKVDCEGCEGLIFSSTPKKYLARIDKMVIEFHDNTSPLKHNDIQRVLGKAGFKTRLNWWIFGKDAPYGYLYGKRFFNRSLE